MNYFTAHSDTTGHERHAALSSLLQSAVMQLFIFRRNSSQNRRISGQIVKMTTLYRCRRHHSAAIYVESSKLDLAAFDIDARCVLTVGQQPLLPYMGMDVWRSEKRHSCGRREFYEAVTWPVVVFDVPLSIASSFVVPGYRFLQKVDFDSSCSARP